MLDLQSNWWSALDSPYAGATEGIPALIEALSKTTGEDFADALMELTEHILHQYSFYSITVAAVPHLIRLLKERENLSAETAQLLSAIGYAVVCEREAVLAEASETTGLPLGEWYRDSLKEGKHLVDQCIRRHDDQWNERQKVEAALCSTALHGDRQETKMLSLLYSGYGMDECEVDACPHCGEYMAVDLRAGELIKSRACFESSKESTKVFTLATFHGLLAELGVLDIRQKVERLWGEVTCDSCGRDFGLWDALCASAW